MATKTLVTIDCNEDFSSIEINENSLGLKVGCLRTDGDYQELDIADYTIIPFTDKVVTAIKIAWRKNNQNPWRLYTQTDQPARYKNNQLVTDRTILCTSTGSFIYNAALVTKEVAMKELLDEENSSFEPKQYSETDYNEGFTNYYDYWMESVGKGNIPVMVGGLKGAIGLGMMARNM